jgi:hypothetical protein
MATSAREIGLRYGKAVGEFKTSSDDAVEDILLTWGNDSIALMAKKIRSKARTGGASTLAQDMVAMPNIQAGVVSIKVITNQDYHDFVDKGVRGIKKNKAPKSKYKFKTMGAGTAMVSSFKKYIARTGMKTFKSQTGKKTKLIRKDKKQQDDIITKAAKELAVATKIGGIKPMNYKAEAINDKRVKQLAQDVGKALGMVLIGKIKQ